MRISVVVRKPAAVDGQLWIWFTILVLAGLLPALINGFPLYQNDSGGYGGANPFGASGRSVVPGSLANLIFPVFGPWALPMVNAVLFGVVLIRFSAVALPNVSMVVVLVGAFAAGVPIFTSSIMPDGWVALAYLTLLLLLIRFSWIDFALCVIAVSGHGLNPYLFLSTLILAVIFFPGFRWYSAKLIVAVLFCSILVESSLNYIGTGEWFPSKLGTAVVASKVINDVPESYDQFCERYPDEKICRLDRKVKARRALKIDKVDQYLWDAGLRAAKGPPDETLTWSEFNAAGVKLGWFVLREFPFDYLAKSLSEYPRMFRGNGCVSDGFGYGNALPDAWRGRGFLNSDDSNSLARLGKFDGSTVCSFLSWGRFLVFIAASLVALYLFFRWSGKLSQQVLILTGALYANDLGFLVTSGWVPRYHDRMLLVAVVIVLLMVNHHLRPNPAKGNTDDL